jgi:hypothetical protein
MRSRLFSKAAHFERDDITFCMRDAVLTIDQRRHESVQVRNTAVESLSTPG